MAPIDDTETELERDPAAASWVKREKGREWEREGERGRKRGREREREICVGLEADFELNPFLVQNV